MLLPQLLDLVYLPALQVYKPSTVIIAAKQVETMGDSGDELQIMSI
jgi:hypothetical protein